MEVLLATERLIKRYGQQKAVDTVSLHVKRGDIYGFVGENGAGKTTFLRLISGLATPTGGSYTLFGQQGAAIRANRGYARLGTLIEAPGFYPGMTALENMMTKCLALGRKDRAYANSLLELVGLADTGRKKISQFSLGMRQRLGIALALIGDPEFLVLDEPINGLDPQGIAEMRDIISKLNQERGITFLISSHILEELAKIATQYGFISHGKLVAEMSRQELLDRCSASIVYVVDRPAEALSILQGLGIQDCTVDGERGIIQREQLGRSGEINRALVLAGHTVTAINHSQESLESFYFHLIGANRHA